MRGPLSSSGREQNRSRPVCFVGWASWTDSAREEKMIFIFPKHFLLNTEVAIKLGKILRFLRKLWKFSYR
jgi:hypothetical protein